VDPRSYLPWLNTSPREFVTQAPDLADWSIDRDFEMAGSLNIGGGNSQHLVHVLCASAAGFCRNSEHSLFEIA
jgi:hypothetical protein